MTQQIINIGINPNDGNGESLRSGGVKINENFTELYSIVGASGEITFVNSVTAGTGISVDTSTGDIVITNTSPNVNAFTTLAVATQTSLAAGSLNRTLTLAAGSNVSITTAPVSNTVTISATQQSVDWNASSGNLQVLNKPNIPTDLYDLTDSHNLLTSISQLSNSGHTLTLDSLGQLNIPTNGSILFPGGIGGFGYDVNEIDILGSTGYVVKITSNGNKTWTFNTAGSLQFPDTSVQTGASISVAELKVLVAASSSFTDFQTRIAAL